MQWSPALWVLTAGTVACLTRTLLSLNALTLEHSLKHLDWMNEPHLAGDAAQTLEVVMRTKNFNTYGARGRRLLAGWDASSVPNTVLPAVAANGGARHEHRLEQKYQPDPDGTELHERKPLNLSTAGRMHFPLSTHECWWESTPNEEANFAALGPESNHTVCRFSNLLIWNQQVSRPAKAFCFQAPNRGMPKTVRHEVANANLACCSQ